mmetsp:Transcript_5983/g.13716  ORF Transcript_5983/g.13716 Transcript_5983/m.13716 type:complete len:466 (-) Transcript_5983:226-1623(-)
MQPMQRHRALRLFRRPLRTKMLRFPLQLQPKYLRPCCLYPQQTLCLRYPAAPSANNSQLAQNSNKVKRESGPSLQSTQLGHVPTASSSLGRNQGQLMAGQPPAIGHVPIQAMQKWSLEGLESHVKELQAANQPVPQAVALLLADARRKADKREAKRLANRRSAATSRNRKKMLIEEMTRDNARLRRHALILSYLPDPVVSISLEGDITFCNMQLERVLKHPIEDLIGANIEDIMVPSSRKIVRRLIRDLVIAEQRALGNGEEGGDLVTDNSKARAPNEVSEENLTSSEPTTRPPMVEVSVKSSKNKPPNDSGEDASSSSNPSGKSKTSSTASGNSGKPSKPSANHEGSESVGSSEGTEIEEKEVLLCFRPIREGDVVSSEFRFVKKHAASSSDDQLKTDSKDGSAKDSHDHDGAEPEPAKVPFKKRRKFGAETELSQTRLGVEEESQQGEQSAAESMINLRQSSS